MAVKRSECSEIEIDELTIGGATYYVVLPEKTEKKTVCFRRLKSDPTKRCTNRAGGGTYHEGTGACKFHGGQTEGRPPTNGRHAIVARKRLENRVNEYLAGDRHELLNLDKELAVVKATFEEYIEQMPSPKSEDYGIGLHRLQQLVGTIGNVVDKISRIENRNALTAAQVLYLRATFADILMKYIRDPDIMEMAVRELATRVGGDIEVNLNRSEYSLPPGNGNG